MSKTQTLDHPLPAGTRVQIKKGIHDPIQGLVVGGAEYVIEGRWKDVFGRSWMDCDGNPACFNYALRSGLAHLPIDNNVYYGKIGALGHLVHYSEVDPIADGSPEAGAA